jgi:hypothetical protein
MHQVIIKSKNSKPLNSIGRFLIISFLFIFDVHICRKKFFKISGLKSIGVFYKFKYLKSQKTIKITSENGLPVIQKNG